MGSWESWAYFQEKQEGLMVCSPNISNYPQFWRQGHEQKKLQWRRQEEVEEVA